MYQFIEYDLNLFNSYMLYLYKYLFKIEDLQIPLNFTWNLDN